MKQRFSSSPRAIDALPDVRQAKRIASLVLRTDGLRLHLVWAALICLVLGGGGLYLIENAFFVVPWVNLYHNSPTLFRLFDALYTLVDVSYLVLIVLPLVYGLARVLYAAADGRRLPLSALFDAFSGGKRYLRALLVMAAKVLPRVLVAALIARMLRAAQSVSSLIGALLLWLLALLVLAVAALLLGLDDALLPLALKNEATGLCKLYRASLRLCAPRLLRILRLKLSFLLWGIASLATLGVLLIAHALPYFVLTHAVWSDAHYAEITSYRKDG